MAKLTHRIGSAIATTVVAISLGLITTTSPSAHAQGAPPLQQGQSGQGSAGQGASQGAPPTQGQAGQAGQGSSSSQGQSGQGKSAGAAQGAGKDAAPPTPTTARGAHFLIKSQLDPSFCIAVASGAVEGRAISLVKCDGNELQRWTFALNMDETNSIVDESQGMCLDGRNVPKSTNPPVTKCRFSDASRFAMTAPGLIKDVKNNKCLAIPAASANAAVSLVECDATKKTQLWQLTR